MAIEVTETGDEKKGQNSQMSNEALLEKFNEMQKTIEALQKTNNAVAFPIGVDNQNALLEKLVKSLSKKSDDDVYGKVGGQYVDEADIDPDDFVEEGKTYFCHQAGYVIVDDKKNGIPVQTPFRTPIVFKYQFTHRKGIGKHQETYNLSSYTSHSKKEIAWLERSTFYGIYIFENTKAAMSVDHSKASKLAKYMSRVGSMDRASLIKAVKQNGLPMLGDLDQMRMQLASLLADNEIKLESSANEIRVKQSLVNSELEEKILNDKIL